MAHRQAATDAEKADRAKDKRLRKKFGDFGLAEHNQRRAGQNYKCAICGGADDAYGPPHTDHYHFKVVATRHYDDFLNAHWGWDASILTELGKPMFTRHGLTKEKAIAATKAAAGPWSVRGILCFKCNKALGVVEKFFGAAYQPEILDRVRDYLRKRLTNA